MAEALPPGSLFVPCAGDLPDRWLDAAGRARTVVYHRWAVTNTDLDRVVRARRSGWTGRLVLCVGPAARYGLLERWSGHADVILAETTALETLPRHLDPRDVPPRDDGAGTPIAILCGLTELRSLLADSLRTGGYRPVASGTTPAPVLVWDVPVLDSTWPDRMRWLASLGPAVVALLGLADRDLVQQARNAGAAACLDLPCDPGDLLYVVDRLRRLAPLPANGPSS
jgi:hypothetical protein